MPENMMASDALLLLKEEPAWKPLHRKVFEYIC